VSNDLEAVVMKCLEKEPAQRFESMAELAEELRRVEEGERTKTRPTRWWHKLGAWWRRRVPWLAMATSLVVTLNVLIGSVTSRRAKAPDGSSALQTIAIPGVDRVGVAIVLGADGRTCLVLGDDRRVRRIDLAGKKVLWTSDPFPFGGLFDAMFSADGKRLAVMNEDIGGEKKLRVFEVENGNLVFEKDTGLGLRPADADELGVRFRQVAISRDGRRVAFGGPPDKQEWHKDEIWLWDERTGKCIFIVGDCSLSTMNFSRSADQLFVGCLRLYPDNQPHKMTLSICELDARLQVPKISHVKYPERHMTKAMSISPDGESVVFGDDGGWIWIHPGGKKLRDLEKTNDVTNALIELLAFDPTGSRLACFSKSQHDAKVVSNRLISVWDAKRMVIQHKWPVDRTVDAMEFTRDGKSVVYSCGNELYVRLLEEPRSK
jgi:WD40 repeat protein